MTSSTTAQGEAKSPIPPATPGHGTRENAAENSRVEERGKGRTKMPNRIASKAVRLTRGTALALGLAVVLALTVGLASTALAANGGNFILGVANGATAVTKLSGNVAGPAMQVINPSTAPAATALSLVTQTNKPPMTVNSRVKVTNLNADQLDGKDSSAFATGVEGKATDSDKLDGNDSSAFAPAGEFGVQEVIDTSGRLPKEGPFTSKGGTLLVSVSGSGFRGSGNAQRPGLIGMAIRSTASPRTTR